MEAARNLEKEMPEQALRDFAPLIEGIMPSSLHVMIRFGKWEDILNEPKYPEFRLVSNAVRYYARSIANSALGNTKAARRELKAFNEAMASVPEDWYLFNNSVASVLPIAQAMIEGELLFREGKYDASFARLRDGIEAEDVLVYDEPTGWMLPVRHALGALLMSQDRFEEAESVYREDLKRNRDNGWALLGLQKSLSAQNKNSDESFVIARKLTTIWESADTIPLSSCYCEPGES